MGTGVGEDASGEGREVESVGAMAIVGKERGVVDSEAERQGMVKMSGVGARPKGPHVVVVE